MSASYEEMKAAVAAKRAELRLEHPDMERDMVDLLATLCATPQLPCEREYEERILQWYRDQGHEVRGRSVLRSIRPPTRDTLDQTKIQMKL